MVTRPIEQVWVDLPADVPSYSKHPTTTSVRVTISLRVGLRMVFRGFNWPRLFPGLFLIGSAAMLAPRFRGKDLC